MLEVVVNDIHVWFNFGKKGDQLWLNLHRLLKTLGVRKTRDNFPVCFRPR